MRLGAMIAILTAAAPAAAQELPMTSEGLSSALAQYFAGADRNRDQRIDRGEAGEALGYARSLLTAKRELEPFTMDVAPDGTPRLSLNENGPLSTAGMVDMAYRLADRDGDQRLSLAEVQAVGRAAFDAADADHDGILDDQERQAAMEKLTLFRKGLSAAD
ncbi:MULTISPECIES: hypothetical protein [unclassified Sphingomonas]|uniref:hypothetical protein n=1 Tax=unclassified Sphingomonas TaxID=196159 RepID=UPI0006FDEF45|nr:MULTISPECIES: hypothetical protein [unclassified Sphingomonas]KQX25488.1 hypothetical protein ASD17_22140 [Sphingomonas sp. Root1294]KQY66480.1 hypothetical protein ASD39_11945 [Sphingomonas sp. Root50]KRB90202.1 hypothetical protein ASE22_15005 [Sphingomonas sp. Root720]